MLIAHDELASLIPHSGDMCLLDGVLAWDQDTITCQAISHRSAHNPLRCAQGLASLHAIEYGAQAVAVHGGLLARAAGHRLPPGFLAAARNVKLHRDWLHDIEAPLTVEAQRLMADGGSFIYQFTVSSQGETLVSGRTTVMAAPATEGAAS